MNIEFCPVPSYCVEMFKTSVQSLNKKYKNASISEMILEVYEINLVGKYSWECAVFEISIQFC